jgi:hypothetical protein
MPIISRASRQKTIGRGKQLRSLIEQAFDRTSIQHRDFFLAAFAQSIDAVSSDTVADFNLRHLQEIIRVQHEIVKRHHSGTAAIHQATSHALRFYNRFGLATTGTLFYAPAPSRLL